MSARPILLSGLATMAIVASAVSSPAQAQQQTYSFDIPAQDLGSALRAFAQKTRVQVIFDGNAMRGKRSRTLQGQHSVDAGLAILLQGSGLVARRNAEGVLVVSRATAATSSPRAGKANAGSVENDDTTAEIVVTGTNIQGAAPAGSPLIVVTREQIEKSGRGRVQDYLEILPQNLGSDGEDSFRNGEITRSAGVDLRGLGSGATLVLVNGRRQPGGGITGSFVDISGISSAAIKRIEILTDGASAIYGSDAVAGVVNFIYRDDYDGFSSKLRIGAINEVGIEIQASQLIGKSWSGGNILVGYEYSRRSNIMCVDLEYCSRNGDYRDLGGSDLRNIRGYPGTVVNPTTGLAAFAIPRGQNGTGLTVGQLVPGANYTDQVTGIAGLPGQETHMAFFNARHDFGGVELFAEGRYSHRHMRLPYTRFTGTFPVPRTNPYWIDIFNGQNYSIAYDFGGDLGTSLMNSNHETISGTFGAKVNLWNDWRVELTASGGRERASWKWENSIGVSRVQECLAAAATCPGLPLNLFGDGQINDPRTVEYIRNTQLGEAEYRIGSLGAIASGSLIDLPAGTAKLALGFDYRDERIEASRSNLAPSTGAVTPATSIGQQKRSIAALFGELSVPLLRSASGGRRLDLSLAGRYEDYSDFGGTFNPKIGIGAQIADGVRLRGSWGTSFKAPSFSQVGTAATPLSVNSTGSVRFGGTYGVRNTVNLSGGNPDLREETADVWTAGLDLDSLLVDRLTTSLTYFNIDYRGKIQSINSNTIAGQPDLYSDLVIFNPPQSLVDFYCNGLFVVASGCLPNITAIRDTRLRNLGGLKLEGLDFTIGYTTDLPLGTLNLGLNGTYMWRYDIAPTASAPFTSQIDIVGFPIDLRARGTIGWSVGNWDLGAAVNYADGNFDPGRQLAVKSQTTVDLNLTRRFTGGWTLRLNASNIFDRAPPFVDTTIGFDAANYSEIGRRVSLSIQKDW
jgi:outer membrane receptor protein involved in Fe transport